MKRLVFPLLLVSLVLNAAFALVFRSGADAAHESASRAAVSPVSSTPKPPALTPAIWSSLKGEDPATLVTRLRAAGFPPEMIRALLTQQVRESFAARRKALEPDYRRIPYWREHVSDPKVQAALSALYREEQKIVSDLLGEDPLSDEKLYLTQQGGRLEFLPPEKADEVRRLIVEINERRSAFFNDGGVHDQTKYAEFNRAQHQRIAAALTPQELFEYDLRNGDSSNLLRENLAAFRPTEAEFRAIFPLRQAYDEKYNFNMGSPSMTADQMRERREAEEHYANQIKALLTPERAAEYERATDWAYRETSILLTRLELPPENAAGLWTIQKEFEKRIAEINRSTPREQQAAALAALQEEAFAKVTPLLGKASRIDTYKQYGGMWLNRLAPRPAPKS